MVGGKDEGRFNVFVIKLKIIIIVVFGIKIGIRCMIVIKFFRKLFWERNYEFGVKKIICLRYKIFFGFLIL